MYKSKALSKEDHRPDRLGPQVRNDGRTDQPQQANQKWNEENGFTFRGAVTAQKEIAGTI